MTQSQIIAAFHTQAQSCAALGSPLMARVMTSLATVWPDAPEDLVRKVAAFRGDPGPRGHSLPLRLAAGLHALVLDGKAGDLAALYAGHHDEGGGDEGLAACLLRVLRAHSGFVCHWIETPPQTNETGRSAVLIAAAAEVVARCGLPLQLSELGASAGLNLNFDRYALRIGDRVWGDAASPVVLCPDWQGALPPEVPIRVVSRAGVDLNPLDPARDGARMLAYVWPDQPARRDRMRRALGMADAHVAQADAADWLDARLARPTAGQCHLVFHTVAHQYFDPATKARISRMLAAVGARATADAPLALVGMEADDRADGAAVTLRLWPGDQLVPLGRAGFHGQWVRWRV